MTKATWIVPGLLSVAVIGGYLAYAAWQQRNELVQAQLSVAEAQNASEQTASELAELREQLASHETRIKALQREKEEATQAHSALEQQVRSELESKDITISELKGKLTVSILDRILFDSGEAVLKPEGEAILEKIASILTQYPNRQVHVIGHTDNIPIRASARSRFPSNWELSTARATAAVRFLSERAGVDPRRLGAVGYGEFHPIADNATMDGRAKNRRIALVILSEELVGSDIVPTVAPPPASEQAPATEPPTIPLTEEPPE
jgi:chemotaxis protein MotB